MASEYMEPLFAELEAEGVIKRNGEFRRNAKGELEPVFVLTEVGKLLAEKERRTS